MTKKQRRQRAHQLIYRGIQLLIDSGTVYSEQPGDETEADQQAIEKIMDQWAQRHFEWSDRA